jgi:hypothetical protein
LRPRDDKENIYNLSGVYQLKCANCPLRYVGQTRHTFKVRFKEHISDIRNNGQSSKFAQHILDTTHEYGNIENTLEVLYIGKKKVRVECLIRKKGSIFIKLVNPSYI